METIEQENKRNRQEALEAKIETELYKSGISDQIVSSAVMPSIIGILSKETIFRDGKLVIQDGTGVDRITDDIPMSLQDRIKELQLGEQTAGLFKNGGQGSATGIAPTGVFRTSMSFAEKEQYVKDWGRDAYDALPLSKAAGA